MMETPLGLLDRLRETGSERDWAVFAAIYYPLVLRWCKRSGCAEDEAMDVVQEVFLDVHLNIIDFKRRRSGSFRAWLRRILLSKLNRMRSRRFPELVEFDELQESIALSHTGNGDSIRFEELLDRAKEIVRTEFEDLSWRAFCETHFADGNPVEVAATLGLSINAVYVARCRITKRMKECLINLLS